MLGSVEVNRLRPEKVEYVNIKVAADLQGPYMYGIKTFFHTFWYLIFDLSAADVFGKKPSKQTGFINISAGH